MIWLLLEWSYICVKNYPVQTFFNMIEFGVDFELGVNYCFVKYNKLLPGQVRTYVSRKVYHKTGGPPWFVDKDNFKL